MKKTIGILGGMGPLATCDLFQKIIQVTDAHRDQDHVRVCIDSNTEIPDRTNAVLYGGASPVPEIVRSGHLLQNMGADVLVMPCNTSHYFYEEIAASLEIPLLHMIRETADVLHRRGIRRAGLMATDGLIRSGLYARLFEAQGIELLIPDDVHQKAVMRMIYENVKGGCFELDTTAFQETARQLLDNGAQTLVLGCTELPVAMQHYGFDFPHIDPTLVLASRAVQFTGTKVREEFLY